MKNKQLALLVVISLLFVTNSFSQHQRYAIKNGFAIGGGISLFNVNTDNFTTTQGTGFVASLSATVDIPHKWFNVSYGMQISQNNFEVSGRMTDDVSGNEQIELSLMMAKLEMLFSTKIIGSHLTFDFGPQLQYNGDFEFKNDEQESYFINGFDNLPASDILELSKFNVNGTVGITAGYGPVKLRAQYAYGFLNMFEKLNSNIDSNTSFKGNPQTIAITALLTF